LVELLIDDFSYIVIVILSCVPFFMTSFCCGK